MTGQISKIDTQIYFKCAQFEGIFFKKLQRSYICMTKAVMGMST